MYSPHMNAWFQKSNTFQHVKNIQFVCLSYIIIMRKTNSSEWHIFVVMYFPHYNLLRYFVERANKTVLAQWKLTLETIMFFDVGIRMSAKTSLLYRICISSFKFLQHSVQQFYLILTSCDMRLRHQHVFSKYGKTAGTHNIFIKLNAEGWENFVS